MKITPLLFGALNAQSGDDADRWDAADFNFNADVFNYDDDATEGKWSATQLAVSAVTCWESNNMGDLDHYVTASDDNQGWGNIHHGHDQASSAGDYQVGSFGANASAAGTNHLDMHSVLAMDNRLSGCIYEAADWNYDATSYNLAYRVEYGADNTGAFSDQGFDESNAEKIRPIWFHYFNAHVLPGHVGGTSSESYKTAGRHLICMANPAYEGLGYLNFIVTYGEYLADNTGYMESSATGYTYNFNTRGLASDNYSGSYAFQISKGEANANTNDNLGNWYSVYGGTAAWTTQMAAVSSFPHNDLGKDFRFNVRVLHKGGLGDPSQDPATCTDCKDSYYWYKVDEIVLTFPHVVRCPKEASNITGDSTPTFRCMDSANNNGHRGWPVRTANAQSSANPHNVNKVAYVETLDVAGSPYAGTLVGATAKDTDTGYICGDTAMADGEWYQCGKNYKVQGLMNTYDEFAQQEYGTMQEFWFQFHYHYTHPYSGTNLNRNADFNKDDAVTAGSNDVAVNDNAKFNNSPLDYDHRHNFPNILFNAFEIDSISFACSDAAGDTRLNSNSC